MFHSYKKTTCITNQLSGLKRWLEVSLCKINKQIKLTLWLESIFSQAGKMQEQFK